jgi:drug/metabolite transporter (DMT)-like permease
MAGERIKGYLSVFVAIFLFSTVEVAAKLIHRLHGPGEIGHLQLAFLRFLFAGMFLLTVLAARGRLRLAAEALRRDALPMLVLGVLGIYVTFTLYYWGLERTRASTAAVVFCVNPVFTAVLARPLLKERFRWSAWVGVGLGLAGALLAIAGTGSSGLPARSELMGGSAVLAAALSWSLYTIVGKRYSEKYGETVVSFTGIAIGSALFLFTILLRGEGRRFLDLHPDTWLICMYIGVLTVGVAYLFYFGGLKKVPASSGASLFFLKPSLAVLLAWLVLGESPGPLWLPVALSSLGIVLTTYHGVEEEWVED